MSATGRRALPMRRAATVVILTAVAARLRGALQTRDRAVLCPCSGPGSAVQHFVLHRVRDTQYDSPVGDRTLDVSTKDSRHILTGTSNSSHYAATLPRKNASICPPVSVQSLSKLATIAFMNGSESATARSLSPRWS